MLSHSHFLKHCKQYSKVYLVSDKARFERGKDKSVVVSELRQRNANRKTNLVVCNGETRESMV